MTSGGLSLVTGGAALNSSDLPAQVPAASPIEDSSDSDEVIEPEIKDSTDLEIKKSSDPQERSGYSNGGGSRVSSKYLTKEQINKEP